MRRTRITSFVAGALILIGLSAASCASSNHYYPKRLRRACRCAQVEQQKPVHECKTVVIASINQQPKAVQ